MAKPRVIIADEDANYIVPFQSKFVTDFYNNIELEIITEKDYFDEFFSRPQNAEILIVSDGLYHSSLQRHNIANIYVMTEQVDEAGTGDLNVDRMFKYTSIKEIFNEIVGKSAGALNVGAVEKKETQIILVTSAAGGVGKTTIAMGVAAGISQSYKRVLYINASRLQNFQYLLDNDTPISSPEVYTKLLNPRENVYDDIKHVIRKELFSYLPSFKAALMSVGIQYSVYEKIALSAKKSGDFDFIVIDAESTFDENKTSLIDISDKVIVVTDQTYSSVQATNRFVVNVNGTTTDKYVFVCNKFDTDQYNALMMPDIPVRLAINEYVQVFQHYEQMKMDDFAKDKSIQRVSFLII